MEEDVFEASESSDSDLEISEGLHRDFEKSSRWGKSLQMLKKMGWKEGEGLGRKQKGMVQIRSGPKKSDHGKDRGAKQGCVFPMVIWPAFRMEKYRVNDHPYHASQFIEKVPSGADS